MTDNISDPAEEWTYRNFLCRVYRLGDIKQIGFVRVGDEWTEVTERTIVGTDITSTVENEVDRIIRQAIRDETDRIDIPLDDGADPNPIIDPNPDPIIDPDRDPADEFPWGPTWNEAVWTYRKL